MRAFSSCQRRLLCLAADLPRSHSLLEACPALADVCDSMLLRRSREEPQIKAALSKFNPRELRTDEAKQAADVEFALRTTARKYVKGEVQIGRASCRERV